VFLLSGSNLGLLGKSFPLLIVSDFTNFYLKIYNLLKNLQVSNVILMIAKLGMENAVKSSRSLIILMTVTPMDGGLVIVQEATLEIGRWKTGL
jgi:hypothetical protein